MITALILTLDEERHIERCIESLKGQCDRIVVIDSGSKDRTIEIAERMGACVLCNPWINYATQMNFAIDVLSGRGGWLLRIDADEVFDSDSAETLSEAVASAPPHVDGIAVQRRIHFLGRRIRHGAIEPSWQLRLWREGRGYCEKRWMDEHIKVDGRVAKSRVVLSDINLNPLTWWTAKHNSYASREAIDTLTAQYRFLDATDGSSGGTSVQAGIRRFIKQRVYFKLPAGLRAASYFFYRYLIRLGFLDGQSGFYFHVLQAFWYRTLVDAKVMEIVEFSRDASVSVVDAIREKTGIDPMAGEPTAAHE